MRNILNEFKTFALRGNVIDLAIGIIVGAAFNKIVNSLVYDIVMPPIGFLLGRVDFSELHISLSGRRYESIAAAKEAGATTINYGLFINAAISFIITAFVVFLMVRFINRLKRVRERTPESAPDTKTCQFCMTEIPFRAVKCPACTSDLAKA